MTDQSVQVKLELGHRAVIRTKPTPEGFTHDWTVYVQGQKGSNIQHFVQKVIFHLHDSFPKPKRAVKEPPYKLQESGYGSFILPIDIYFRNKEEPRQIRFDYDLFLHLNGNPPVNHVRCELLTFQNPTDDFRQKLLKAGGVIIGGSSETPALTPPPPAPMHTDLFDAPVLVDGRRKKHKHHHKEKKSKVRSGSSGLTSGSSTPSSTGGTSNQSYPKHGGKVPLGDSSSSAEKSPSKDKSGLKHPSEAAVSPAARDHVALPVPSPAKRPADLAFSPAARCPADVISPCSSSSSSKKQRREKDSNSKDRGKGSSSGEKSSHSRKEKSRSKDSKSKSRKSSKRNHKDTDSKSSHFDSDRKSVSSNKSTSVTAPKVKLPAFEEELSTGELSEPDPFEDNINTDTAIGLKTSTDKPLDKTCGRGLSALIAELGEGDCDSDSHEELLSPLSATSPPVLFPEFQDTTKQHVPIEKLPLKNSSPGIKSERFSPLAADTSRPSPAKASQSSPCSDKLIIHKVSPSDKYSIKKVSPLRLDATVVSSQEKSGKSKHDRTKKSKSDKKPKEHRSKDKENEESTSTGSSSTRERKSDITHRAEQVSTPVGIATEPDQDKDASLLPLNQIDRSKQHAPNGESLSTLLDLQERLMMMTDARLLQKIVSIIEETGNYKINDTTFDFDLYCLDRSTVQKLLGFLLHATS